jgi:hypothetical protein
MANIAQAPVEFSGPYTVLTGTAVQYIQTTAAGVTAGLPSGNFFLTSPQSDLLNGERFVVQFSGWFKSHGTSQTLAIGLYANPFTSSSNPTGNGTLTSATAVASGTLTAGTYYDFTFSQVMFGESNANTLTFGTPTIYIAGAAVTQAQNSTPLAVTFGNASQTEPITGINNTFDWPLANFYVAVTDGVSDTTATLQLTEFFISQA